MVVQQVDNDDQDTKDQKKYLGPELYDILQEVRKLIDLGELDDKEEESVIKPVNTVSPRAQPENQEKQPAE